MKTPPKVYIAPVPSTLPITESELLAFGVPQSCIDAGEMRAECKSVGPWSIVRTIRALCVSSVYQQESLSPCLTPRVSETVYGMRTLDKCQSIGYDMEGRVSVGGKSIRGFTSSQLFELPSGKLINVTTIHACLGQPK